MRRMFGLPWATTLLLFGFPALWVIYTIAFFLYSRDWEKGDRP
jgi:hypothetical protein